ncbi:hypothetical protein CHH61_03705 [Shouchella clausii]|uniref:Lipoprotein n=1 Tax=Shouchella clausii TaxID=79880 RepID=A0A268S461_SHOCL|nr:hypothetical protein [Shouchella clausii]PAF27338.1 hypothetical protein CHH61_03705 [Shouchella clausii]
MLLKKRRLTIFLVVSAVLFFTTACGNEDASGVDDNNGPQDGSPNDVLPLSDAFVEYPVWVGSRGEELSRDTPINTIVLFEDGAVKYYDYRDSGDLTMEDIVDMTDEEIVKHAQGSAEEIDLGQYSLDVVLDESGNNPEMEQVITQSEDVDIEFSNESISMEFFGTHFSGMKMKRFPVDGSDRFGTFLTRTNDSLASFTLDDPGNDKEKVTVEGK